MSSVGRGGSFDTVSFFSVVVLGLSMISLSRNPATFLIKGSKK